MNQVDITQKVVGGLELSNYFIKHPITKRKKAKCGEFKKLVDIIKEKKMKQTPV